MAELPARQPADQHQTPQGQQEGPCGPAQTPARQAGLEAGYLLAAPSWASPYLVAFFFVAGFLRAAAFFAAGFFLEAFFFAARSRLAFTDAGSEPS